MMGGPGSGGLKTPTALKLIRGTEERYINRNEPKPQIDVTPNGPLSPGAVEEWHRIVPDLIATGVATGWDVEALMQMCECVATLHECREAFRVDGRIVGNRVHPMWKVYVDTHRMFVTLAARLGLTPADRAGIVVGKNRKTTPGADLLSGS